MTDCEILSFCTGSVHLRPLRYFLNCEKRNTIMCAQTSQFCVCRWAFYISKLDPWMNQLLRIWVSHGLLPWKFVWVLFFIGDLIWKFIIWDICNLIRIWIFWEQHEEFILKGCFSWTYFFLLKQKSKTVHNRAPSPQFERLNDFGQKTQ